MRYDAAHRAEVDRAEASLPIDEMVRGAVAATAVENFRYPVLEYPVTQRGTHGGPATDLEH